MFQFEKKAQPILSFKASQLDIETALSNDALRDELKANSELFANEYSEFFEAIAKNSKYANLDDLCLQVLSSLTDPLLGENDLDEGMYSGVTTGANFKKQINILHDEVIKPAVEAGSKRPTLAPSTLRVSRLQDIVRYVSNLKWMLENIEFYADRLELALDVVIALENVFLYTLSVPSRIEVTIQVDEKFNSFYQFNTKNTYLLNLKLPTFI